MLGSDSTKTRESTSSSSTTVAIIPELHGCACTRPFHTIVENQMAANEPVVVETLTRLRKEGLSRHDAVHAIGLVLAAQVYDVLKREQPDTGKDPNEAYATELRRLTAESWHNAG